SVLGGLVTRWRMRNFLLVCPSCKNVAAKRGRYMLGEERLTCNRCGATDSVTFWRFEGIAQRACTAEPRTVKARGDRKSRRSSLALHRGMASVLHLDSSASADSR